MMKKLLISLATLFTLTAVAQETKMIKDANAVARNLNGSFTAIDVSGGIEIYLSQGSEESLAVSASDQKYMDRFKTEVVNGTLKIWFDNNNYHYKSERGKKLKAYVSFRSISKLNVSSGAEATVYGSITSDELSLDVSSGASLHGGMNVKNMTADISSGASVKITGKSDKIKANLSSGAEFKGYDFAVDYCDAKASSGANMHITINKELSAKAGSGADIRYKGAGLIRDIKVSGGGAVKKS